MRLKKQNRYCAHAKSILNNSLNNNSIISITSLFISCVDRLISTDAIKRSDENSL